MKDKWIDKQSREPDVIPFRYLVADSLLSVAMMVMIVILAGLGTMILGN